MSSDLPVRILVDQLKPIVHDDELCGRLYADLTDILRTCSWFVSAIGAATERTLTQDELETLLIDVDVNVVQHLGYHLDSLKKYLPTVLDAVGDPSAEDAG